MSAQLNPETPHGQQRVRNRDHPAHKLAAVDNTKIAFLNSRVVTVRSGAMVARSAPNVLRAPYLTLTYLNHLLSNGYLPCIVLSVHDFLSNSNINKPEIFPRAARVEKRIVKP